MPAPLPIQPLVRALDHTLSLPGSKSITNRALILAALADGETHLEGALFSRDTRIMLAALELLGIETISDEATARITVKGQGGRIPCDNARIDVGNAGTAARFLTAFLALNDGGVYRLDGDAAMRQRPIAGLLESLVSLDAADFKFHGDPAHFPFTLYAKGYKGGKTTVDAKASSQILSALLLASPCTTKGSRQAEGPIKLICPEVRPHYVAITLKMREAFGAASIVATEAGEYDLPPASYSTPASGSYAIEPDISAASYFLALTLIHGGSLRIPNLSDDPLQSDAHFVEVLAQHGLQVDASRDEWTATCSETNIPQRGHREINFNSISDTFLTYAAISPLLGDSVRITGIAHTRHQETDRIAGMAAELSKLGQLVKEEEDALTIQPKPNELRARAMQARKAGQLLCIDTYEDHRFAMSFAVLASYDLLGDGKPWLAIKDPNCCAKTYPGFFDALDSLRHA
ncbi:MAG: 3-phosphoshikimate 1-carboxyvinyltransferase [Verrucomicrobiota bacterium]|nr:3-phosphoshikimate 1-carboxyvinyltransferase [Verrucomicrobiota bacterium]